MPKQRKHRRVRNIPTAGRALFLAVFLAAIPAMFSQTQRPADECQDVQKHIKKEHDRFKDTDTVRLDEMLLSEKSLQNEKLTLQVEVTVNTEKQSNAKDVKLIFKSQAPRLRLYQGQEALFLADGQRIKSISAVDDMTDQFGTSTRFEKKNVVIAYDDLVKIANAESVEMRLGAIETKFDGKVLKALHGFVSCGLKQ